MDPITFTVLAGVTVAMNCGATVLVSRDRLLSPQQRRLQLALAWAVPLVGSGLVIGVNRARAAQPGRPALSSGDDNALEPSTDVSAFAAPHGGPPQDSGHGASE